MGEMAFDKWKFPFHNPKMNTTVTLDKAGRAVIPKRLRDALRLAPGDELVLESEGDRVTLRPVCSSRHVGAGCYFLQRARAS
jgi:AbrB family looped-hinge helix DNA binding protein